MGKQAARVGLKGPDGARAAAIIKVAKVMADADARCEGRLVGEWDWSRRPGRCSSRPGAA